MSLSLYNVPLSEVRQPNDSQVTGFAQQGNRIMNYYKYHMKYIEIVEDPDNATAGREKLVSHNCREYKCG